MSEFAFDDSSHMATAIRRMVADHGTELAHASLRVHPSDDMFAFSWNLTSTPELGIMAYFRAGLQIHDTWSQIARWYFGSVDAITSACDFASGYGRSTRFLASTLPPDRVWSVEILDAAVEFQGTEYGVHAVRSATDPDRWSSPQQFDYIFVSSLFSHLPDATFRRWLATLHSSLAPGGLLAFSVHDDALLKPEEFGQMPPNGLLFIASSEVSDLSTEDYGATFVTEDYVAAAIKEVTGRSDYWRLPQALCFEQDIYLVPNEPVPDRSAPEIGRGVAGVVDTVRLSEGVLTLTGWAADLDSEHEPALVTVELDGTKLGMSRPDVARPDVAEHLRSTQPIHASCGWRGSFPVGSKSLNAEQILLVKAYPGDGSGPGFVLHSVPLGDLVAVPKAGASQLPFQVASKLEHLADLLRREGFKGTGTAVVQKATGRWKSPSA